MAEQRWTIYPHAGERVWSTEMVDEWKRDLGVGVVPKAQADKLAEALRFIARAEHTVGRDAAEVARAALDAYEKEG